MFDLFTEATWMALAGLFGGVLLGLAARMGRFCTLGAIEDLFYGGSDLRLRMWGVCIGVAVIGTFTLSSIGWLDLSETLYLSRAWNPVAHVFGGLMFGYGMALAGNCGYGALARLGGGDLRSFVIVITIGLSAYVALGGPLAAARVWAFGPTQPAAGLGSFAAEIAKLTSLSIHTSGILTGGLIMLLALSSRPMRRAPAQIFWGAIAGVAIVSGWAATHWVASNGFAATPVISHTFSAPIGETILYVMTSSGNSISFGTGSVLGVLAGAFIGSLIKGHFRWEACDDPRELRRQILGAILMGIGAVIAIGCSIGQGVSAFSVLAFSAPLTLGSILLGAALGLRQLILGFAPSR